MKKVVPKNNFSLNYELLIQDFISKLNQKQSDNLVSVFLTGSYAKKLLKLD